MHMHSVGALWDAPDAAVTCPISTTQVGGSTVTDTQLSSGRAFDSYAIDHTTLLGKGSFGTVVRAVHRQTNKPYACKVLNISHIMPAYIDKLHSEIMVMRQVSECQRKSRAEW